MADFTFIKLLDGGTTGVVWHAKDNALQRDVAIKFFHQSLSPNKDGVINHANALAKINHPNVVQIFGIYDLRRPGDASAEAEPALVMEYVPGQTFTDWCARTDLAPPEVLAVVTSLLAGLAAFHGQKIGHGDLHGRNVHIVGTTPKIIDPVAHDPTIVLTTGGFREQQVRDIHFVRVLIADALGATQTDDQAYGEFCLLPTGGVSLSLLGEHARRALVLAGGIAANRSGGVRPTFYNSCRRAQAARNVVDWQECRKTAIRTLQPQLDFWAGRVTKLARDEVLARESIYELVNAVSDWTSFCAASVEVGDELFGRDVRAVQQILQVNWMNAGESRYVGIPQGLIYIVHHLCGAAACENRNPGAIATMLQLRTTDPYEGAQPIWTQTALVGWPSLFSASCTLAFRFLLDAYGRVPLLRDLFPSRSSYTASLCAYNIACCCYVIARGDFEAARSEAEGRSRQLITPVPPMFILADSESVRLAYELVFADREFLNVLLSGSAIRPDDVRAIWEGWVKQVGERFSSGGDLQIARAVRGLPKLNAM